jgi:hypothetical protein
MDVLSYLLTVIITNNFCCFVVGYIRHNNDSTTASLRYASFAQVLNKNNDTATKMTVVSARLDN